MMGDPLIDEAIALGRVPKDITADYLNESRDRPAIVAIIFATCFTGLIVVGRLVSRAFIIRRFGVDDALALLSLMIMIAFTGLCLELINLGIGRHFAYLEYVLPISTVQRSEVFDFVAHILYTTALLLCRISVLSFYHRICTKQRGFIISIYTVLALLLAAYIPQLFLIIFHCQPVTALWPYTSNDPGHQQYICLSWGVVYVTNSSISVLCDLLIFVIPVAILQCLVISRRRRIELACILLPGVVVIAISAARLALVVRSKWEPDMSWSYGPLLAVEVSEIGATLIALSVPGFKPLVDRYLRSYSIASENPGNRFRNRAALDNLELRSYSSNETDCEERICSRLQQNKIDEDGIYVKYNFGVENESKSQSGGRRERAA